MLNRIFQINKFSFYTQYLIHVIVYIAGLEADLFYVHEGAVNIYAMQFTVPVPADVYDLEFSWQSLTTHPVSI